MRHVFFTLCHPNTNKKHVVSYLLKKMSLKIAFFPRSRGMNLKNVNHPDFTIEKIVMYGERWKPFSINLLFLSFKYLEGFVISLSILFYYSSKTFLIFFSIILNVLSKFLLCFSLSSYVTLGAIWYHLYNFKKREKHRWRSVTFSKVPGFSLQLY